MMFSCAVEKGVHSLMANSEQRMPNRVFPAALMKCSFTSPGTELQASVAGVHFKLHPGLCHVAGFRFGKQQAIIN